MKQTLIINIGVSGAGKSTWTTEFIKNHPEFLRINRDDLRKTFKGSLDGYYGKTDSNFNKLENMINDIEEYLFVKILSSNKSLIIDNTNLRQVYIKRWLDLVHIWNMDKDPLDSLEIKFKIFYEKDRDTLRARIVKRENLYELPQNSYIEKQIESLDNVISWVEKNFKHLIINE